jgi:hypothetical protein
MTARRARPARCSRRAARGPFGLRGAILAAAAALGPLPALADPCSALARAAGPAEAAGAPELLGVLARVPDDAHWADVAPEAKLALGRAAAATQARFRDAWGQAALAAKEAALLECGTPETSRALDRFLGLVLLPDRPGFRLAAVQDAALRTALVRVYLAAFAAERAAISYPDHRYPDLDWDGRSPFDSFAQPDAAAYADIRAYAGGVVASLRGVAGDALPPAERLVRERALFAARELAAGGFLRDGMGGRDLELPCQLSGAGSEIVLAYRDGAGPPAGLRDDAGVVAQFNAMYLPGTRLQWADTGTRAAALSYGLCTQDIEADIDEHVAPRHAAAARAMHLLRRWWVDRLRALPLPPRTLYTDADRALVWDAFTSSQHTDNDGRETMEQLAQRTLALGAAQAARYRELATRAVAAIFPDDTVLRPAERARVLGEIGTLRQFASMRHAVAAVLDHAQDTVDGPAARAWEAAFRAHVAYLGGRVDPHGNVDPADVAQARAMFREVQAWLAKRYEGYPVAFAALFDRIGIVIDADASPFTGADGTIRLGLGVSRPLLEHYSQIIHESRHAVRAWTVAHAADPARVATDDGVALEGSGVAAEDLLRDEFLRATVHDELAVLLYQVEFGLRDARFIATTQATLQRYERGADPADARSTEEAARAVALAYGLTGPLADTLVQRAHAGTQYLQYVYAGERVKDDLAWLEHAIDPAGHVRLDPFILFACNQDTPQRDEAYVARLAACVKAARPAGKP